MTSTRCSGRSGHLDVARTIAAEPRAAWELLIDTHRWPEWGPSVRGVKCADRYVREGSTGRVRVPGGIRVPFEIDSFTDFEEPIGGSSTESPTDGSATAAWHWRVAKLPATGHRVEAIDDRTARVVFEVPVLAAGYVPVCRRALQRIEDCLR